MAPHPRSIRIALLLIAALQLSGCVSTVFVEIAKKANEDRPSADLMTDTQIGASILSGFVEKDSNLLLDVNADVWERKVLLTGTVEDAKTRADIVKYVSDDDRVKRVYDEIQIASPAELERRRKAAQKHSESQQQGVAQFVDDFWVEAKVSAQLIATQGITSVNYRWRCVRGILYIIGRANSRDELNAVYAVVRNTRGVNRVKSFVEIKPTTRAPSAGAG
jgi:hyperosmotically inducible protein